METVDAVTALAALAQTHRLEIFRLLVGAGPGGLAAGEVAAKLGLAPNTLTFHFDRLRHAALVTVRREGRAMIYAARFDAMNDLLGFLTDQCCAGHPDLCRPARKPGAAPRQSAPREALRQETLEQETPGTRMRGDQE